MPVFESTIPVLLLWGAVGYLFGSIPSGVILAKTLNLGDLREIGSGNIGATNVLRTGDKRAAALTLIFDMLKGAAAVALAGLFAASDAVQIAGLMAFLGHCFPVWLKFKGGKGVATFFGVWLGMVPTLFVVAAGIWLVVAAVSRRSSLAALITAGWLPVVAAFTGYFDLFWFGVVLSLLIYARHWRNIQRLRDGTEPRIGASTEK